MDNYHVSVSFTGKGYSEVVGSFSSLDLAESVASEYGYGYHGKTNIVKVLEVKNGKIIVLKTI